MLSVNDKGKVRFMFNILALVNFLGAFLSLISAISLLVANNYNASTMCFIYVAFGVLGGIFFIGVGQILKEIKNIFKKTESIDRHLCGGLQYICDNIADTLGK